MTAAYMSFRTGRSPKACGMIFVRRRSSRKSRSSRFVVRITRRWRSGKRRWAMQASKSSRKHCTRSVRKLIPCSGRAVLVPQEPAQPLAATNVSAIARKRFWRDQVVPEPLMIPLSMVVGYELVEDTDQAPFPEENQAVETLLANRAHEPFRVGVGVRRLDGREDDANPRAFHDVSESLGPLAVPVADEDPMARQEPLDGVGETTRRLGHECGIGIGRRPHHVNPPAPEIDHKGRVLGHQPTRRPDFGRAEVGPGDPLCLSTLATVLLATRWSRFFNAPWM